MRSVARLRVAISPSGPTISRTQPQILSTFRSRPQLSSNSRPTHSTSLLRASTRSFSASATVKKEDFTARAKELHQKSADEHEDAFNSQIDNAIGQAKELQARTPWHREGSDKPPVKRMRSAGAMTKGLFSFTSFFTNANPTLSFSSN